MKKKLIGIILVLTLVAIVFAGCGEKSSVETPSFRSYSYFRTDENDMEKVFIVIEQIHGMKPKLSEVEWRVLDHNDKVIDDGKPDESMVLGNESLYWNPDWTYLDIEYSHVGFIDTEEMDILDQNDYFVIRVKDNTPEGIGEFDGSLELIFLPSGQSMGVYNFW